MDALTLFSGEVKIYQFPHKSQKHQCDVGQEDRYNILTQLV